MDKRRMAWFMIGLTLCFAVILLGTVASMFVWEALASIEMYYSTEIEFDLARAVSFGVCMITTAIAVDSGIIPWIETQMNAKH